MKRLYLWTMLVCSAPQLFAQSASVPFSTKEYIDVNDIKAAQLVHGDMWWDPVAQEPSCEYPKGSGKHAAFSSALWMGGFDQQQQLHVSAQTYRQDGNDYWPGPIDNTTPISYNESQKWARIWKINRTTIDSFKSMPTHTVANTQTTILEWPGKGNPYAKGYNGVPLTITKPMAPFKDVNNDGIYNPLDGDYPNIKGDQMLWWIFNDNGPDHGQSHGLPLDVEVMATAYAYNKPGALNTIIYYDFSLSNKGSMTYDSLVVGLHADMDLGYFNDDYIGFDSSHRMGIVYNGTSIDGSGQINSYGNDIPISAVTIIQAPGDNANVHKAASSFMYYNNDFNNFGNPATGSQYYGYLTGTFKGGAHLVNDWDGIPGHSSSGTTNGPTANYVFPGDPSNSSQWSECQSANPPGDRRFVISSNAFSLQPGSTESLGLALLIQPHVGGCPNTSFTAIKNMADSAWYYYYNPPIASTNIKNLAMPIGWKMYPNPAQENLFIEMNEPIGVNATVDVFDVSGRKMQLNFSAKNNIIELNTKSLSKGFYTISYKNSKQVQTAVFIKQ